MVRRVVPNIATIDPSIGHDFYTDMLGLDVVMDVGGVVTFAAPGNPTAQLNLVRSDPSAPLPDYSIEVSDVEARYRRARQQRRSILYPLTTEPWGVRRFFVRDPHGKVVNVMQHINGGGA